MKKKLVSIGLFSLVLLGLLTGYMPHAKASMTGNYIEEITLPDGVTPTVVDVDSEGRIFINDKEDVYRSTDNGDSWSRVYEGGQTQDMRCIFVDSRDYIFATPWTANNDFKIIRSVDNGDTWTDVLDPCHVLWHWSESSNGTLYANTYSGSAYVYASLDSGATWSVWLNITGEDDHIHTVRVNPNNDDVWLGVGDTNKTIRRWNSDTETWTTLVTGNGQQPTDFFFDDTYAYICPDTYYQVLRMPHRGVWADAEKVFDIAKGPQTAGNWVYYGVTIGDIKLFGTVEGQLWGSADGVRWVKLFEDADNDIIWISQRPPIHFVDATANKLYRLSIQKKDIIHLYNEYYLTLRGGRTNAESFVLEQRLDNGTNYVDLSDVALRDVQVTIKGLSEYNNFTNSGFETGDTTEWTLGGTGTATVQNTTIANGTYGLQIEKNSEDAYDKTFDQDYMNFQASDIIVMSLYAKANVTGTDKLEFQFNEEGVGVKKYDRFELTTSWQRFNLYYVVPSDATLKCVFLLKKGLSMIGYFDSTLLEIKQLGMVNCASEDNSIQHIKYACQDYFDGSLNTTDPSILIDSQTVSHSGELSNGTSSSATSLTGTKSGVLSATFTATESDHAIIYLTGTRIMTSSNVVVHGKSSDDVFYGVYYGTMIMTGGPQFAVLSCVQAEITINQKTVDFISFTVDAPTGFTSTIKIYCATTGKPKQVTGATEWSYDSSMRIATIQVWHTSAMPVTVSWGSATGLYPLTISVLQNGMPTFAYVVIGGENKTVFGFPATSVTFELPYGNYFILAYCGDQRQTKSIFLSGPQNVGFDFTVSESPNWGMLGWTIPVIIAVVVGLYFLLFRKR